MGAMKTTLEISDPLLREARKVAARENTTLRALVEQGLRQVVAEKKKEKPFRLRNASFKGDGLHPDVANMSWQEILDLSYEGRGT
jgi:Bacterial antitoxin of type II TA system, VapB